jgi:hypothetical protein
LVGPGTWRALAPLLEAGGRRTVVADFRKALLGAPPLYFSIGRSIAEQLSAIPPSDEIVVVVHSGAGALAPMLARNNRQIRRAVFVDALLPHPGKCWFDTAPATLAAHLHSLAKGGYLPRWHRWWPQGSIEAMIPDEAVRDAFIGELYEVPVSYLEEVAPLGDVPDTVACSYLQLSAACKADADGAKRRGWRVERLDLNHLAMLTHADQVAAVLPGLIGD